MIKSVIDIRLVLFVLIAIFGGAGYLVLENVHKVLQNPGYLAMLMCAFSTLLTIFLFQQIRKELIKNQINDLCYQMRKRKTIELLERQTLEDIEKSRMFYQINSHHQKMMQELMEKPVNNND